MIFSIVKSLNFEPKRKNRTEKGVNLPGSGMVMKQAKHRQKTYIANSQEIVKQKKLKILLDRFTYFVKAEFVLQKGVWLMVIMQASRQQSARIRKHLKTNFGQTLPEYCKTIGVNYRYILRWTNGTLKIICKSGRQGVGASDVLLLINLLNSQGDI